MEYEELYNAMKEYAEKNGFKLNPNEKVVAAVIKGLLAKEREYGRRYCPCRRVTGDPEKDKLIVCPCVYHKKEIKEMGHCYCGLFARG